ncbi:MAG: hypothetical protein AAFY28_18335 [Actinomycetota bacterium]
MQAPRDVIHEPYCVDGVIVSERRSAKEETTLIVPQLLNAPFGVGDANGSLLVIVAQAILPWGARVRVEDNAARVAENIALHLVMESRTNKRRLCVCTQRSLDANNPTLTIVVNGMFAAETTDVRHPTTYDAATCIKVRRAHRAGRLDDFREVPESVVRVAMLKCETSGI